MPFLPEEVLHNNPLVESRRGILPGAGFRGGQEAPHSIWQMARYVDNLASRLPELPPINPKFANQQFKGVQDMTKIQLTGGQITPLLAALMLLSGITVFFSFKNPGSLEKKENTVMERVDSLLALMTLEEKVGQLVQYSGSAELTGPKAKNAFSQEEIALIKSGGVGSMLNVLTVEGTREAQRLAVENSRLGIPLIFGYDVIHGFRTMFPIPLGEAASWDPEAIEKSARTAASEASAAGLHWTFGPMVDITRDARWGRIMEGAGEDPYLGSRVAAARVRGFQGEDLSDPSTLAACAKHYAAYGFPDGGRDYNTVDISESKLRNVVLPPFKACVDAGVRTFMNAFNELNGIPATGHRHLLRNILKDEWGFDGFVVSDWGSVEEMIEHGYAAGHRHAAELAIEAGTDMDMEGDCYDAHLTDLVESGQVDVSHIDDAVRRVLRVKFELGIMDDPYRYCNPEREKAEILTGVNLAISRDVARKSIVLLKNAGNLLPISKSTNRIAVIGPLADDKNTPLGNWRAQAISNSAVSVLEGVQDAVADNVEILYEKGCELRMNPWSFREELEINEYDTRGIDDAVKAARRADIVILVVGEDSQQSGEGRSQVNIGIPGVQPELIEKVLDANPNTVMVLMNGRPLDLRWASENVPAIVEAWHLGSEAGNAIADVLFGEYNPSGKLPVSFPRHVGQIPVYYNHKNTGRPEPGNGVFWSHYTDESNAALFPFGYGLSYTTFAYSPVKLSAERVGMEETIEVSVDVTNTGERAGAEVVQLYIRDLVASLTRPVKELKGFRKINLAPGETQTVPFRISTEDLNFWHPEKGWITEPGRFKVMVGTNSRDLQEAEFEITR